MRRGALFTLPIMALVAVSSSALAQTPGTGPLPPLPPPVAPSPSSPASSPPAQPPPPPPQGGRSYGPSPYGDAPYNRTQPNELAAPDTGPPPAPLSPMPPPVIYTPPPEPVHAPKFSLWTGARLGFVGFGGYFYNNSRTLPDGSIGYSGETTGNLVGNGLSAGLDVGARLGKRYVPYVFLEHGFMKQGHRFEVTDATSSTDLLGIGFRYTAGDVDSAGFLTDLSIGVRKVTIKSGGDTYTMSSLELFRLGLGAEVRISTLFVLSPMVTISGGTMTDTSGSVTFAPGQGDGNTRPRYHDGQQIDDTRSYVVIGVHCGAHFDVFGK